MLEGAVKRLPLLWTLAVSLTATVCSPPAVAQATVKCVETTERITVRSGEQELLTYHKQAVASPAGFDPVYARSGYVHPVRTLSGRAVTGDFAPDHAHQHALFGAWVKTEFNGHAVDFWNLHKRTGRVAHRRVLAIENDAAGAGFRVEHVYQDMTDPRQPVAALIETWTVKVPHPTDGVLVFDIDIEQRCASESTLKLPRYHYGGMALRGSNAWFRADADRLHAAWAKQVANDPQTPPPAVESIGFDFLTSEGRHRHDGNHTAARWVDMTGLVEGQLAGIAMLSHPSNFRAPQHVRLHPTKPYFCFTPMITAGFEISPRQPYRARYRYVVHDGAPDVGQLTTQWQAFAQAEASEQE